MNMEVCMNNYNNHGYTNRIYISGLEVYVMSKCIYIYIEVHLIWCNV